MMNTATVTTTTTVEALAELVLTVARRGDQLTAAPRNVNGTRVLTMRGRERDLILPSARTDEALQQAAHSVASAAILRTRNGKADRVDVKVGGQRVAIIIAESVDPSTVAA